MLLGGLGWCREFLRRRGVVRTGAARDRIDKIRRQAEAVA